MITNDDQFSLKIENDSLDSIHNELISLYESNLLKNMEIEDIAQGVPCCCLYNELIYRTKITSVNFLDLKARVLYVDYGNEEEVSFKRYLLYFIIF